MTSEILTIELHELRWWMKVAYVIELWFLFICVSYQMLGKLGGHAGHIMTLLLLGSEEPYLILTGSRDHYIKVKWIFKGKKIGT